MDASFDLSLLAVSGSFDGKLHLWDVKGAASTSRRSSCLDQGMSFAGWHGPPVSALAVDHKAQRLVSGSYAGRLSLWSLKEGCLSECEAHAGAVRAIVAHFG